MFALLRHILLLLALSGLFAQAHARSRLPAPIAIGVQAMGDCKDAMPGMEPASDLLGEAAMTEAQERDAPFGGITLDCISMKGCLMLALAAQHVVFAEGSPPMPLLPATHILIHAPYRLVDRAIDPPRA